MTLDKNHRLYQLSQAIDWKYVRSALYDFFDEDESRFRFITGMLYLKVSENLSTEQAIKKWKECPYSRFLCGEEQALTLQKFPYPAGVIDVWDREFLGQGYEVMIAAVHRRSPQLPPERSLSPHTGSNTLH